MASSRRADSSLPRWARVNKRDSSNNKSKRDLSSSLLSIPQEESYLRTRTYHATARHVDEAVQHALDEHVGPVVKNMAAFFDMVGPNKEETEAEEPLLRKRIRADSFSSSDDDDDDSATAHDAQLFAWEPPLKYPPTLLPVALLHGPMSTLDRHEIMRYLHDFFASNKRHERSDATIATITKRPAVCWLRRLNDADKFGHDNVGTLLQEVLRQCVAQDASTNQRHHTHARHTSKKKKQSSAEALIDWARHTTAFDSIILLVEGVEGMQGNTILQDVLCCLARLRSEFGLPLYVVIQCLPSQQLPLRSSSQGMVGMLLGDFVLPSSPVLYDCVSNAIWMDRPLSVVIPPAILRAIRESFVLDHASFVQSILLLKQAIAQHFTKIGSFLAGLEDPELIREEHRRMQWFCVNEEARSHAFANVSDDSIECKQRVQESADTRRAYIAILRILRDVSEETKEKLPSAMDLVEPSFSRQAFDKELIRLFRRSSTSDNLIRLARYRALLQGDSSSGWPPSQLHPLFRNLNELIILVVKCEETESNSARRKELEEMIQEWTHEAYKEGARLLLAQTEDSNVAGCDSVSPEPRRLISEALLAGPPSKENSGVTDVPSELFALIQDCVVISREEWFERFWRRWHSSEGIQDLWSKFAFGVYQLEHYGFVNEKSGSTKSDRVYEKTALVWCSGD